jgi:hypothetical protein
MADQRCGNPFSTKIATPRPPMCMCKQSRRCRMRTARRRRGPHRHRLRPSRTSRAGRSRVGVRAPPLRVWLLAWRLAVRARLGAGALVRMRLDAGSHRESAGGGHSAYAPEAGGGEQCAEVCAVELLAACVDGHVEREAGGELSSRVVRLLVEEHLVRSGEVRSGQVRSGGPMPGPRRGAPGEVRHWRRRDGTRRSGQVRRR